MTMYRNVPLFLMELYVTYLLKKLHYPSGFPLEFRKTVIYNVIVRETAAL